MNKIISLVFSAVSAAILASCGNLQEAAEGETVSQLTPLVSDTFSEITEHSAQEEGNMEKIKITVGDKSFTAVLYGNETANAFAEMLPMTLDMSELNGNEKYFYLSDDLPTASERPDKINSGDIMLYGSGCVVLFYDTFSTSYSYTRIGYTEDSSGLAEALGKGGVSVKFEKIS